MLFVKKITDNVDFSKKAEKQHALGYATLPCVVRLRFGVHDRSVAMTLIFPTDLKPSLSVKSFLSSSDFRVVLKMIRQLFSYRAISGDVFIVTDTDVLCRQGFVVSYC